MNRTTSLLPTLLLLVVTQPLVAASNQVPYKPFPPAWQATLDLMTVPLPGSNEGIVPGAVVVIKSPAFGVRVGTTGYADIPAKRPMSPDYHFRVGSVTKSFTAQTVLRLEQEGKLKLTDPIVKYLGDDPTVMQIPNIQQVTIGEALQMSSGIANYLGSSIGVAPLTQPDKAYTPDDLLAVLSPKNCPPLAPSFAPLGSYQNPYWYMLNPTAAAPPPFAWWDYSNSNYILLGMIIEKITGQPIQNAIEQKILRPAGLADTYFATDASFPPNMIHGYAHMDPTVSRVIWPTWHDVTNVNATWAWAAGAIISTPWDLLKYVDTIFQTNTILNPGTKEKWLTLVAADIHWPGMQYGEGGLMQGQRVYGDLRGHGGAFWGYKTLMYYFPDSETTFILCTNTQDANAANPAPEVEILDSIMPLVKSAVTTPVPADAAAAPLTGENSVNLAWQAGRVYGTSYNVYVGTDAAKVESATSTSYPGVTMTTVTNPTAAIASMKPNQTYYWRVDTITANQPLQITTNTPISPFVAPIPPVVNGPVWSFRTTRR